MKGLVFTQLLDMAEHTVGEKGVDSMLDRCQLETGGAYTAVGNYPCSELNTLVKALSSDVKLDIATLQNQFGHWMFRYFERTYPHYFHDKSNAFDMLEAIEDEVHAEVRKLNEKAELPRFDVRRPNPNTLVFVYQSPRGLVDFCQGLIEACLVHFGEQATIARTESRSGSDVVARFVIRRTGPVPVNE